MNLTSFYKFLFFWVVLSLLFASSSWAWQVTMSNVDGTLTAGDTYTITVEFEGESTDYLDLISFAIEWNTSLIELADFPELAEYTRGSGFNQYTLWMESPIASIPDVDNGRWYDVSGETDLDHMGEFYPEATGETLIATFTFKALSSGYYEDLAGFYFTQEKDLSEFIDINGESYRADNGDLIIVKENGNSILRPLFYELADISAQNANVGTETNPIEVTITPMDSGRINVTASSSDTDIVTDDSIDIWADNEGTPIANPINVTGGTPITLYLSITPAGNATGTSAITVTAADAADAARSASTSFDLTVALAEATMSTPNDDDPSDDAYISFRNASPVVIKGNKAIGSRILLQVDGGGSEEIAGADIEGEWAYDWYLDGDGEYEYVLINQAGAIEEAIVEATLILDTLTPQVPITDYEIVSVRYNSKEATDAHNLAIRATAPVGADSNKYKICVDGEKGAGTADYYDNATNNDNGIGVGRRLSNGREYRAVPIPVDHAGNEPADCSGTPVIWTFEADHSRLQAIEITLVDTDGGSPHVEIKWDADDALADARVWARESSTDTAYTELSGETVLTDNENYWLLKDTATTAIRSYRLTAADPDTVLAEFISGENAVDPDDSDDSNDSGGSGGGGGGGCFIDTVHYQAH